MSLGNELEMYHDLISLMKIAEEMKEELEFFNSRYPSSHVEKLLEQYKEWYDTQTS